MSPTFLCTGTFSTDRKELDQDDAETQVSQTPPSLPRSLHKAKGREGAMGVEGEGKVGFVMSVTRHGKGSQPDLSLVSTFMWSQGCRVSFANLGAGMSLNTFFILQPCGCQGGCLVRCSCKTANLFCKNGCKCRPGRCSNRTVHVSYKFNRIS